MSEQPIALHILNIKKKYVIKQVIKRPDSRIERLKLMAHNVIHPIQANAK